MKNIAWVPFFLTLVIAQDNSLFFSEYAEGSEGSNKYVEIYNGTGSSVDLSDYQVWGSNNGSDWKPERQHDLTGTLSDGDVYVIAADAASQAILDETDLALAYESALHYNGDDAIGLAKDNGTGTFELIDVIGVPDVDPGSGWDVADTTNGTKDHTLIRKSTITAGNTDWSASAGTNTDDSEWLVHLPPTNTYTPVTLGSHPHTDLEAQDNSLFFSEYAEGSSNNKYLEIYNGTGADVDLSSYLIMQNSNGGPWDEYVDTLSGTLANGDVYVIANSSADASILAEADLTGSGICYFNGDDARALIKVVSGDTIILDYIGSFPDDPGSGWDVAGTTNGTQNHTLVRKSTVTIGNTDWSASAGTTADNSEWIVLDQDTWDYVGSHPHTDLEANDPALVITSPENGSTLYSTDVTVSFTVSNFTVATSGGDGHVHYTVDGGTTVMQYTTDDIALTGLSESSHTVIVWLADNSHANLSPHVADTVAFTVSTLTVTSIYDIQFVSDPTTDDASPLDGQTVTISGVVTAEFWGSSSNRYLYVQDAEGPWNGVVCFEYNGWDTFNFVSSTGITNSVAEGDSVTVTGTVDEYYNLTEIVDVTDVIVHGPAVNMISPAVVTPGQIMTGGSDAEAYEGCLVKVDNVTVDNADLGNGEWSVTDGTNSMRVDDIWDYYYFPESGQALAGVAGVMTYTYSDAKLEPRLARDVVEADGTPVRLQRIQQVLYSDLIKAGVDEESDMSYMYGDTVTVVGIVTMPTGLSYAGAGIKFIFQDENGGPWSSILSYDPDSSAFPVLYEGDSIQATGYVYEYSTGPANMTELFITEPVNILEVGVALPDTADVNTGDLRWPTEAEQWGTVMVRATDAIVVESDLPFGEWSIDDGTGKVNVDDDSDSIIVWQEAVGRPPVGSYVSSIRGWVYHHYGTNADSTAYKIEPLYVADIEFGAGPPNITDVSRDPCVPGVDDVVTVSAVITDNSTISEAHIYYRVDDGDWNIVDMSNTVDDTWSGSIPASGTDGAFIEYFVKAADDGADQSEIKWSEFPDTDNGNYLGYDTSSSALTINNVQHSPWPNGESPYNGCDVTVTGIVTADTAQYNSGYAAYAFQSASAQWSGVVFDGWDDSMLSRGDEVTVSGTVEEFDPEWHFKYDGNTKLINVSAVTVNSAGNSMASMSVSTADLGQDAEEVESYEGCLVTVSGVTISAMNAYDWGIIDDSGVECLIDDDMATIVADNYMSTLEEGTTLSQVTGIFNFSFGTYKIQVRDLADLGQLGVDENFESLPRRFALYNNYPNPFNPETRIRFEVGKQENVRLIIYDMLGRKVRTLVNDNYNPGMYVINWDGMNDSRQPVSSGPYLYRIKAGEFIDHKKMILVR